MLENIHFMENYADPYHKRPMKLGEIGCFLSHYTIWTEVIARNYTRVLVLEDDIRFEPYFRTKINHLLRELTRTEWDLIYLGRKRMSHTDTEKTQTGTRGDIETNNNVTETENGNLAETWVPNTTMLVHAGYSYWTLGYILNRSGAKKLLDAQPLQNLAPVDEYLPMLFDQHPRVDWKMHFPRRDLIALSAAPLLLYPTHYTGEDGYISDTEDSTLIPNDPTLHDDL